jgi:hypothetical protein
MSMSVVERTTSAVPMSDAMQCNLLVGGGGGYGSPSSLSVLLY